MKMHYPDKNLVSGCSDVFSFTQNHRNRGGSEQAFIKCYNMLEYIRILAGYDNVLALFQHYEGVCV